jgi:hypothetical protein
MEYENKYGSRGAANTGLGLGIAGTALGVLNGGLGNLLGGAWGNNCVCSDDHFVNRYEAGQSARIAELETEVKLRDSNIYTDSKILDVYKYFDGENKAIRAELANQAVKNAQIEGTFAVLGEQNKAMRNELCAHSLVRKTSVAAAIIVSQPILTRHSIPNSSWTLRQALPQRSSLPTTPYITAAVATSNQTKRGRQ